MVQVAEQTVVQKRGPGRPRKNAPPIVKKPRLSTTTSIREATPVPSPPAQKPVIKLPTSALEHRPLPTLPEAQSLNLPDSDYQSLAQSAVVRISLDRSRKRWTQDGIFARYWVKPATGKNAKPPPEGNPEFKWMKEKGECRIRVEPHIFEVLLYVEEKPIPKPIPPPKQYIHQGNTGTYGQQQPYRQQPVQQQPYRHQPHTVQPFQPRPPHLAPSQRPTPPQAKSQEQELKKPDPVISMLAARAQADPQLKTLMKEVANGHASQDQLRVFQRHIDELTKIINKQKAEEEKSGLPSQGRDKEHDDATNSRTTTPVPVHNQALPPAQPPKQHQVPQPQLPMYPLQPAQPWTPPPAPIPPAPKPVVLSFKTPEATEDRFLFPQNSILEPLSPNHTLASFVVTRKGREAADNTAGLDHFKEYWQPVTIMVEVPNGREALMQHIRDWVRPAEEVRKHMEETMARCIRAPETHLALRLPFKGSKEASTEDILPRSETPVLPEDKPRKKTVVYVKKGSTATPGNVASQASSNATSAAVKPGNGKNVPETLVASEEPAVLPGPPDEAAKALEKTPNSKIADAAVTAENPAGTGRPRRAIRKSVRISEG